MSKLIFAPSARQDLSDIYDFISRDKPVAAANWIDKIELKCKLIASQPEIGEDRADLGTGVFSSLVGRYIVFYRRIDQGVEIVRVIRGERDIRSL